MELPRAVAMTVKDEHSVVGPVGTLHRFFSKNGGIKRVGGLVIHISRSNCKEASFGSSVRPDWIYATLFAIEY